MSHENDSVMNQSVYRWNVMNQVFFSLLMIQPCKSSRLNIGFSDHQKTPSGAARALFAKLGVELVWNPVVPCSFLWFVCLLQQLHDGFWSKILETWWRNTSENIKITWAVEKQH